MLAAGVACCGWSVVGAGLQLREHRLTTIGGLCLRHEMAHHFGADERRVREMGL